MIVLLHASLVLRTANVDKPQHYQGCEHTSKPLAVELLLKYAERVQLKQRVAVRHVAAVAADQEGRFGVWIWNSFDGQRRRRRRL